MPAILHFGGACCHCSVLSEKVLPAVNLSLAILHTLFDTASSLIMSMTPSAVHPGWRLDLSAHDVASVCWRWRDDLLGVGEQGDHHHSVVAPATCSAIALWAAEETGYLRRRRYLSENLRARGTPGATSQSQRHR